MKTYTFATPSHKVLLDDWFMPSFLDNKDEIIIEYHEQSGSGRFMEQGWMKTMEKKVLLVKRAIKECTNKTFLHVDCDIQFFKPCHEYLEELLEKVDVVAQEDSPGELCAGLFACRATTLVKDLWDSVWPWTKSHKGQNDQHAFNALIKRSEVKYRLLPKDLFFSPRGLWKPGKDLKPTSNIMAHHANWCIGVKHKIEQMRLVRKKVTGNENI